MKYINQALEISGIEPKASILEDFDKYSNLILSYSKKFNLTGIKNQKQITEELIIRSLRITKNFGGKVNPGDWFNEKKLIDIGTGAGIPGIPLKIILPELSVTLLDSNKKKCSFLEEVIKELDLKKIDVINARAEDLAHDHKHREKYDIVTARALAPLTTLSELCVPFISIGGTGIFPKGDNVQKEINDSKKFIEFLGCAPPLYKIVESPGFSPKDIILYIMKIEKTSNKFPRKSGIPSKRPYKL